MSDQGFQVAVCPGQCGNKVRIWPEGINMCCQNCWGWTWFQTTGEIPADEHGVGVARHSPQCDGRQRIRQDWVVTEGTFDLVGPSPEKIAMLKSGVANL